MVMKGLVDLRIVKRLALVVMALFPTMWGLLGDLNNATAFSSTANNAVRPLIEMTNTYGNPWHLRSAPRCWNYCRRPA
jgi:hypothetical protein